MERQPIVSKSEEEIAIKLIQQPLTLKDLLPKYQFQFQDISVPIEATNMYSELVDFLTTNEELAFMSSQPQEEYVKGFQRALSMVRLWIDSIYLDKPE